MFIVLFFISSLLSISDTSSINNNPGSVSIHENYDATHNLWSVSATCYVRYTTSYYVRSVIYQSCGWWGWSTCSIYFSSIRYKYAYTNVACNRFYINSDPSGNFQMSGSTVQKKTCTSTYCGPSCNADGCLNNGESHTVGVTAYRTGYETNGAVSGSFTVNVYKANDPSFYFSAGNSISVSHDTAGIGTVINTLVPSYEDDNNDYDYIRYRQDSGPGSSYIHGTSDLFYLDTSNGQVKVQKDLTNEFSYYFTMKLCVYDRRHYDHCLDLSITLWACFQTPTCYDQSDNSIRDTYGTYTTHGGSSNTIFNMDYPDPTEHFPDFSPVWHDLTWTFDLNEFPEATINSDTGEIYVTRNISIWPAWPTQDYNMVVRVANSESCYTTTCSFKVRIHYTNWPIDILTLPRTYELHEDYDLEIDIHSLITYDYNYSWEDNVTCQIDALSPNEANMFELRHDGNHAYDSYKLYKLRCQTPNCGYKYQSPIPYYCDTDIGCLTHNRTQQYTVTIKCWDGYDSTDTEDFTFTVIKNAVPAYINLHATAHIDLNRRTVSYLDNIFEIMYSDGENENLIYEYTYQDVDTGVDPNYFLGTTWGNYYDQLGNITMTTYLWDKDVNKTYRIHICGHERRNEICEDLTVDVEEYCSLMPQCYDDSFSTNTEFAVGDELFDISSLVHGSTFNDLSYSIKSDPSTLFSVDSSTGSVTLAEEFDEIFDSATYSIVAYVYNDGACDYAQCQLTVVVTAVNYPIEITNLPESVSISEDTTTSQTLFIIATSDDNPTDTFTCEIVNTNSVEPFYLDRIPPVSGNYQILNRKNGGLSSATTTYSVSIECTDSHGESDTDVLTITITLNEAPTFTSFTTGTNHESADPMDYKVGDTLYTVAATDHEGDELTFTCIIANSQVPYECEPEATAVKLKINRELREVDDNGQIYSVRICLKDAKHDDQCGDLDVTFTRNKTHPEITNLPDSKSFPEDTSVGTTLFEAVIYNPDVGESETVAVRVDPISELSVFNLDTSNGILTIGQFLDFERVNSYMFTFTVSDDYLDGLAEKTLKVDVTNVNEGNSISITNATISFPEDTAAGIELTDPGLSCEDIDGDQTSYAIQSGLHNDYFSIDSNNGRISLVKIWDLEDSSTALPSSTSLILSCTDPGGLSSTTAITVNVEDVNDHSPVLVIDPGYTLPIAITGTTKLYADLMTFSASDLDVSDDNDFDFTILGEGVGAEYFRMVKSGSSTAKLRLRKAPDFINDKTFSITIKVSDGETPPLFDGETISVNYTAGDPDENKSKPDTKCLTCTSSGNALLVVLIVECIVIAIFLLHIFFTCCGFKSAAKSNRRMDLSKNQRFKRLSKPSGSKLSGLTSSVMTMKLKGSAITNTDVIEMNRVRSSNNKNIREESTSESSSSLSSDSEDDHNYWPFKGRQDLGHSRPSPAHDGSVVRIPGPSGLPPPMYSLRVTSNSSGPGGLDPGFIV